MGRVGEAIVPTAELALIAVAIGAIAGMAGAVAASGPWLAPRARVWVDRVFVGIAAMPLVAFAPVATWALAARFRLVPLPGDPDAGAAGLVFASALLAIPLGAHVGRVSRAALDEVARAQFLVTARPKGSRRSASGSFTASRRSSAQS